MTHRPCRAPFPLRLLGLLTLLIASPVGAQNLLTNGGFDTNIAGWTQVSPDLSLSWSPLDAQGSPSSGSLRAVNSAATDNNGYASVSQCLPTTAGGRYVARGRFLLPAGQARSGAAAVGVYFMDGPSCSGNVLLQVGDEGVLAPGVWLSLAGESTAPPGTQSVYLGFGFRKVGGGGTLAFHLDNAVFQIGDPAPPAGEWITVPDLPDFRFKVRITPQGQLSRPGTEVSDCVPETVCVAGTLPDRTETFLRVIGPRPNGYLWPQIIKFTVSRVEVWIEQLGSGQVNFYDLPALPADTAELPGLVDKTGFLP